MALSLYDVSVGTFLQVLGGVETVLARGLSHFEENSLVPSEIIDTRLHPDMLPFRFQVIAVAHHSAGAIQGVKTGTFGPPTAMPSADYAGLQKLVTGAREELQKVTAEEINDLAGKDVVFEIRDTKIPFVAEDFLLSFSLPNFYFHATTTYDILRMKGVPLGKRDFLGRMRIKR